MTACTGVCPVVARVRPGTGVRAGALGLRDPPGPDAGPGSGRERGAVAATDVRVPQKTQYFQAGCSVRSQFTQAVTGRDYRFRGDAHAP